MPYAIAWHRVTQLAVGLKFDCEDGESYPQNGTSRDELSNLFNWENDVLSFTPTERISLGGEWTWRLKVLAIRSRGRYSHPVNCPVAARDKQLVALKEAPALLDSWPFGVDCCLGNIGTVIERRA